MFIGQLFKKNLNFGVFGRQGVISGSQTSWSQTSAHPYKYVLLVRRETFIMIKTVLLMKNLMMIISLPDDDLSEIVSK